MKHLFTGDPWYNTQGLGSGLERMGFRPGPVNVNIVRPLVGAQPTFGAPTQPMVQQGPAFQKKAVQYNPSPMPTPYNGATKRVEQGPKASCPVCRKFG